MVSSPFSGRRGLVNLFKDASRSRNNSQSSLQLDNTSSQPTSSSPPQPQMSRSQSLYHHSRAPVAPPHSTESLSDRPLPSIPTSPSGLNSRSSSRGVAPDSKYATPPQPQRRTKDPAAALPPTPRQAKSGHGVPLTTKSKDTFYKRLSRAAVAAFNAPEVGNHHHHHNNKKAVETDQDLAETYTAYLSLESSDISSSETSNIHGGGPSPSVHDNNHSTESRKSDNNNNNPTPSTTTTTTNDSNKKKKKGEKEDEQQQQQQDGGGGGGLEERCQKLQYMLDAKESEYQKISTNFHKHMMSIRATDDDYSTIRSKLTMLQSKIAALPLALKKNAVDPMTITHFFSQTWPDLSPAMDALTDKKTKALGYNMICMFVEKLIMQELVHSIYNVPVYIGLPANDAFVEITRYMDSYDHDWSVRLRQQLCKLAHRSSTSTQQQEGDSSSSSTAEAKSIADAKQDLVNRLVKLLLHVYNDSNALENRVSKLVETAAELSLAMHSQESAVDPLVIAEGTDSLDEDLMVTQNGSVDNSKTVRIVISPPFVYNETNRQCVLMKAKVICF